VTGWAEYLDALEAAVHDLDADLIEGRAPSVAALDALTIPETAMPEKLADRRALVVALLADVTGRATARRDAVASELLALPRRRTPSPGGAANLGENLDITG
jgi:hypothetical protein